MNYRTKIKKEKEKKQKNDDNGDNNSNNINNNEEWKRGNDRYMNRTVLMALNRIKREVYCK